MILSPGESVISIRPMVSGADESAMAGVDAIVTGKIAGGPLTSPTANRRRQVNRRFALRP